MDHYTAIVSIMFLAFFEVLAICYSYGKNNSLALGCLILKLFMCVYTDLFTFCHYSICDEHGCLLICRSNSALEQPRRDDWEKSKHLFQTMLANCCTCVDHCKSKSYLFVLQTRLKRLHYTKLGKSSLFHATKIVVVVLLQVILIFSIIEFRPARYESYVFPPWAQGVGWIIALASIIWIPVCAVHTLWVLPGSMLQVTSVRYLPHCFQRLLEMCLLASCFPPKISQKIQLL